VLNDLDFTEDKTQSLILFGYFIQIFGHFFDFIDPVQGFCKPACSLGVPVNNRPLDGPIRAHFPIVAAWKL